MRQATDLDGNVDDFDFGTGRPRPQDYSFLYDEPLSQKYFKASVGQYANVLTASSPDAALKILASGGDAHFSGRER